MVLGLIAVVSCDPADPPAPVSLGNGVSTVAGTRLMGEPIPGIATYLGPQSRTWSAALELRGNPVDVYERFRTQARRLGLGEMEPARVACRTPPPASDGTGTQTTTTTRAGTAPVVPPRPSWKRGDWVTCLGEGHAGARALTVGIRACGGCSTEFATEGVFVRSTVAGAFGGQRIATPTIVRATGAVKRWPAVAGTRIRTRIVEPQSENCAVTWLEVHDPPDVVWRRLQRGLENIGGGADSWAGRVRGRSVRQTVASWTGGDGSIWLIEGGPSGPLAAVEACDDP